MRVFVSGNSVRRPPRLGLILFHAALSILYLLFFVANLPVHAASHLHPMQSRNYVGTDFARFWFVGRSFDTGHATLPSPAKEGFQRDILSARAGNAVWLYPPTMNLPAMLFARLPLWLSFWAWRGFSWLLAGALLRYAGLPWLVILAGVLSPAGLHDTLGGQNGTVCAALTVSALLLMDRLPRTAGMLAGLLCIKPQAGLAFPFILIPKRLPALCGALITAAVLIGGSLLLQGIRPWVWFFSMAQPAGRRILEIPLHTYFQAGGCTVFMMARSLHASLACAWSIQAACAIAAGLSIRRLWHAPATCAVARMAATISLAALISPYGFLYDLTGFGVAMAAMMFSPAAGAMRPAFAILWLAGGYGLTVANLTGLLLFPLVAAIGAALCMSLLSPKIARRPSFAMSRNPTR